MINRWSIDDQSMINRSFDHSMINRSLDQSMINRSLDQSMINRSIDEQSINRSCIRARPSRKIWVFPCSTRTLIKNLSHGMIFSQSEEFNDTVDHATAPCSTKKGNQEGEGRKPTTWRCSKSTSIVGWFPAAKRRGRGMPHQQVFRLASAREFGRWWYALQQGWGSSKRVLPCSTDEVGKTNTSIGSYMRASKACTRS